jgi:lipoprotein-anchoring transpeptidase ErfK/SrfK
VNLARLVVGAAVAAVLLTGCTAEPSIQPGVGASPSASTAPPAPPVTLAITPATQTAALPVSTEIGLTVSNGSVDSVVLTDSAGKAVTGSMREDKTAWVPDQPLKYNTRYAAAVTATGGGTSVTQSVEFTTMAKPGKRNAAGLYLFADKAYGTAMPVVVEFTSPVPEDARAGVQSRLFVTTSPPQPGAWAWMSGKQVTYRAKEYWQPGTKIEVRVALEGHPMGDGRYGESDRRGTGNISQDHIEMLVENSTKQMTVKKNGQVLRTIPVSLGAAKTPSSAGTMVVMEKLAKTVFDTTNEPGDVDRYRVDIEYAQRLTWSGEYIHAAPWSVGDQGRNNVSHGCVNVSMEAAKWLFDLTRIGDPITIAGTEQRVASGDGFMPWSYTWDEYIQRSAIPVAG